MVPETVLRIFLAEEIERIILTILQLERTSTSNLQKTVWIVMKLAGWGAGIYLVIGYLFKSLAVSASIAILHVLVLQREV